jgi:transcriptional regulator with XRE-family HTH domain
MKLSDYLAAENLTRDAFAQRLGVHSVTVSKWCTGSQRPSWFFLGRILEITGGAVTATDFMPDAPAGQAAAVAVPAGE